MPSVAAGKFSSAENSVPALMGKRIHAADLSSGGLWNSRRVRAMVTPAIQNRPE